MISQSAGYMCLCLYRVYLLKVYLILHRVYPNTLNISWMPWQVRKQILYILQVLPSGVFVKVQYIGPHCGDDDELVLEVQQEQERRWRSHHPQVQA